MAIVLVLGVAGFLVVHSTIKWIKRNNEREAKRVQEEETRKRVQKIKEKVKRIKRKKV